MILLKNKQRKKKTKTNLQRQTKAVEVVAPLRKAEVVEEEPFQEEVEEEEVLPY